MTYWGCFRSQKLQTLYVINFRLDENPWISNRWYCIRLSRTKWIECLGAGPWPISARFHGAGGWSGLTSSPVTSRHRHCPVPVQWWHPASWGWGCRVTGDTGLCGRGPSQHSWSLCQELQLHPHSYRILEGLINYHGTETCTQWKIEYHSFTWYLLCKEELGLWLVSSNPFRIESGRQSNVGQFQFKGIHK